MITESWNNDSKDFRAKDNGSFDNYISLCNFVHNDTLDLSYNNLNDDKFSDIIYSIIKENINGIKKIKLNGNEIGSKGIKVFLSNIKFFNQTEELQLEDIHFKSDYKLLSQNFKNLSNLKSLNLRSTNINDFIMTEQLVKGLKNLELLEFLDLSQNEFTDKGVRELAGVFERINNLKHLSLNNNKITQKGMIYLTNNFKNIMKLEYLNISYNEINAEGFDALSQNLNLTKQLKHLITNNNKMGSLGLKYLSGAFRYLHNLEILNVSQNDIEKEGCLPFADNIFHLVNLTVLIFEKNKIDDGMYLILSNLYIIKNLHTIIINTI